MLSRVSVLRNSLYYIVFESKRISVSDAQKLIFNFTLITCHNIVVCDLESHAIAIKHCFGMRQPHVWCFL